jgi:hypothetical protein
VIARVVVRALVVLIRLYQVTLSPFVGRFCRFQPTCSRYAIEALETHGPLRGAFFAARRILRCHPWGGSGWDPVPEGPPLVADPRTSRRPGTPRKAT